jgi:potassium-transporting ATPase KdpC subunit
MTSAYVSASRSLRQYWVGLRVLLVLTVLLGVAYPLAVTAVSQAVFRSHANGSLVTADGRVVGSSLIGQSFADSKGNPLPQWFQPRPSAAGADGYDPTASGASNLGPSNNTLVQQIQARRAAAAARDGVAAATVPPDALTASGSGLDPQVSPAYAYEQVNRVAKARGMSPSVVRALVAAHVAGRELGFLGEPTVDVLELNLALAALSRLRS